MTDFQSQEPELQESLSEMVVRMNRRIDELTIQLQATLKTTRILFKYRSGIPEEEFDEIFAKFITLHDQIVEWERHKTLKSDTKVGARMRNCPVRDLELDEFFDALHDTPKCT